jgi:hypothetical protein
MSDAQRLRGRIHPAYVLIDQLGLSPRRSHAGGALNQAGRCSRGAIRRHCIETTSSRIINVIGNWNLLRRPKRA